jgi:hypothetical protein
MGICGHKDYEKNKNCNKPIPEYLNGGLSEINKNLDNKESEQFKDMDEWEGEKYKGEGIKKMRAYKCDLNINDLSKLREEFWSMLCYNI